MDTETNPSTSPAVTPTLDYGQPAPAPWKRWVRWGVVALVVVIVGYLIFGRGGDEGPKYTTQEVTKGDLTVTVTATGNLEPRNQVDIGSELSGTIRSVAVDVNDEVKAGQVLTKLDTSRLEAQVLQAQSSLASAQARVLQAIASLKESRANYARLQKVRELSGNKLPSQQDMDVAEAAVSQGEGEEAAARAAVAQAQANLDVVKTDLSKTDIKSPINGVVLVRSIEPGQTVASSLQAPVLFTLAEDLKKMELHVSVDEADIGSVQVGQAASFTVDAFPNRQFHAKITRVDYASNNTQKSSSASASQSSGATATSTGVVTYETVLEVDNSDLALRPGMTATAEIVTTSIKDAVLVPNAALRFTPTGVEVPGQPQNPQAASRGALSALMPTMPRRMFGGQQRGGGNMGRVWVLQDGKPVAAMFRPGPSDGRVTQVLPHGDMAGNARFAQRMANDPNLKAAFERKIEPGMQIITDEEAPKK
ncbi:MAG TPA: efflux RND transporter periplasmic adaptor subunit [Steroidobacteraceae bacterium]|nr:efflux RND transporter periplasmic adaptor subunit [Steroidobacteraceae bacterium]